MTHSEPPERLWLVKIENEYGVNYLVPVLDADGVEEYRRNGHEIVEYVQSDVLTIDARQELHEYKLDLTEFDPKPGTIITCKLPSGTPPDIVEKLTMFLGKHFPDNRVVVMHKDMEIEAE